MQQERRRYFRIQDTVLLQADIVKSSDLASRLEAFKLNRRQLSSTQSFSPNLAEQLSDLQAIQKQSPELARYLTNLQRQVDRLSKAVLSERTAPESEEKRVSLSAQGIAYYTDQIFQPVDIVALTLQLIPSDFQMLIYARVVIVEESDDETVEGRYRVSLDFEHIHDADREALVKHIHSRQLQDLGSAQNVAS